MHKGAAALLWGEPAHDACQRFLLAPSVPTGVGGTLPPRLAPGGGNGKGGDPIPCCRRRIPSLAIALPLPSRSPVQGRLNALAPEHLEVVHCLLPMLDRVPLGAHVPQCRIQQLYRRILARE